MATIVYVGSFDPPLFHLDLFFTCFASFPSNPLIVIISIIIPLSSCTSHLFFLQFKLSLPLLRIAFSPRPAGQQQL